MPRKKSVNQSEAEPSSRPVKKFKSDPEANGAGEPVSRRSLRTRAQNENKVSNPSPAKSAKGPAEDNQTENSSTRPKRNALRNADEKPPKQSINYKDSCPLEVSVQVTPCDLFDRVNAASTDLGSRKRKVKSSPKQTEKKSKLASPGSQASAESDEYSTNLDTSVDNSDLDLSILDNLKAKYEEAIVRHRSCGHEGQVGLPLQLPSRDTDPLFTRSVVTSHQLGVKEGANVSVMTYNILADCHRQKQNLNYNYTSDAHLSMNFRAYRLVEEIKHFDSDVVCLQEVDDFFYKDSLKMVMRVLGYAGVFYKRKGTEYPEGCCTFYKTSQFRLESNHTFSYTQLANKDIDRSEHTEEVKELLRQHVNKEAVLLASKLTHLPSNKQLVIGNTHLTWTWFKDLDISCMQMCYAFKEMDRLSDHGDTPLMLVGDFNTRSTDPGYQLATEGYMNDSSIKVLQQLNTVKFPDGRQKALVDLLWCAFQHPARNISSTYSSLTGSEPEKTSENGVMNDAVDYMWYNQLSPTSVTIVNKIEHSMPNILYPSDHLSLHATYTF